MLAMVCCLALVSCGEESLDYNHPDVDLFVKQLKAGKYSAQSPEGLSNVPKFAKEDIEELLKYAEDLTVIPSFPLAPVFAWDITPRWDAKWCMWMPKTMRASTS